MVLTRNSYIIKHVKNTMSNNITGLIAINSYRLIPQNEFKIKRFKEEFKKFNIDLDVKTTVEIFPYIVNNSTKSLVDLSKYKFCLFLDKDETYCRLIEKYIPTFNSSSALEKCNDKVKTTIELLNSGINLPTTIPAPLCYGLFNENIDDRINMFFDNLESKLTYPMVCKCSYGSLGLKVFLIKNRDELNKKYRELILVPHLYQEYIKSSFGTDYRIFVVNNQVVAYMKRVNETDFRSNIALGGKGYNIKPSQEYFDLAINASKILGLDYAGVDVLIGENNQPILSEVNSNSFLNEIEAISNVNIAYKIASHIVTKLKLN